MSWTEFGVTPLSTPPALLFVNKEARKEALKHFSPFKGELGGAVVFANLERDVFWYSYMPSPSYLFSHGSPNRAKKVAIPISTWEKLFSEDLIDPENDEQEIIKDWDRYMFTDFQYYAVLEEITLVIEACHTVE